MEPHPSVMEHASAVLTAAAAASLKIATAESCTGGLLSAVLTEIEGVSHAFERGFVVYTDDAKIELLNVSRDTIEAKGAVSPECAREMAVGAVGRSRADLAVAITGYAGSPGEGAESGLVHFALATRGGLAPRVRTERFDHTTRNRVRLACLRVALELLDEGIPLVAAATAARMPVA